MKKLLFAALLLCVPTLIWAQQPGVPFNGLITDPSGKGVKAKITVKHGSRYTVSDKGGKFGLTNVASSDTLVIRVKSNTVEIPVAGRGSMKIVWVPENLSVGEDQGLVDCGFGYIKRREYTSSSSGISGEVMRQRGYNDLQAAILAMVPSLQLVNGAIVIRGVGSINSANGALLIYDGSPISSLGNIPINDVESVEVQKGANMYGIRGANGVIIIRSRKK